MYCVLTTGTSELGQSGGYDQRTREVVICKICIPASFDQQFELECLFADRTVTSWCNRSHTCRTCRSRRRC